MSVNKRWVSVRIMRHFDCFEYKQKYWEPTEFIKTWLDLQCGNKIIVIDWFRNKNRINKLILSFKLSIYKSYKLLERKFY